MDIDMGVDQSGKDVQDVQDDQDVRIVKDNQDDLDGQEQGSDLGENEDEPEDVQNVEVKVKESQEEEEELVAEPPGPNQKVLEMQQHVFGELDQLLMEVNTNAIPSFNRNVTLPKLDINIDPTAKRISRSQLMNTKTNELPLTDNKMKSGKSKDEPQEEVDDEMDSSGEEDFQESQIVTYINRNDDQKKLLEKIRENPIEDYSQTDANPFEDDINQFAQIAKPDSSKKKSRVSPKKSAQKKKKETPQKTATPKKNSNTKKERSTNENTNTKKEDPNSKKSYINQEEGK